METISCEQYLKSLNQLANSIKNDILQKNQSVIFRADLLKNDAITFVIKNKNTDISQFNKIEITNTAAAPQSSQTQIKISTYDAILPQLKTCERCELHKLTVVNRVAGVGNILRPIVMFIGKAPKADITTPPKEKILPFSGEAGQIIEGITTKVLMLKMNEIYITNLIKCALPEDKNLVKKILESCKSYLLEEIEKLQPLCICTMGNEPTRALLENQISGKINITEIHGNVYKFNNIPVLPTLNPSAFLKHLDVNQVKRRMVYEDMKKLKKIIDSLR